MQGATEVIIAEALGSDSESNQQQRHGGAVTNDFPTTGLRNADPHQTGDGKTEVVKNASPMTASTQKLG